jgi:hypothetical protein
LKFSLAERLVAGSADIGIWRDLLTAIGTVAIAVADEYAAFDADGLIVIHSDAAVFTVHIVLLCVFLTCSYCIITRSDLQGGFLIFTSGHGKVIEESGICTSGDGNRLRLATVSRADGCSAARMQKSNKLLWENGLPFSPLALQGNATVLATLRVVNDKKHPRDRG